MQCKQGCAKRITVRTRKPSKVKNTSGDLEAAVDGLAAERGGDSELQVSQKLIGFNVRYFMYRHGIGESR